MSEPFDIQEYMTRGVERVVADALKATLKIPRESAYMAKFTLASHAASKKRKISEDAGAGAICTVPDAIPAVIMRLWMRSP